MELYAATVQRLKPAAADKGLYLAFGAEMGFDADPAAQRPAKELVESTPFDVIINSVHFAGGLDLYFPEYFKGRTKSRLTSCISTRYTKVCSPNFPLT